MKKILLLSFLSVLLYACGEKNQATETKKNFDFPKGETIAEGVDKVADVVIYDDTMFFSAFPSLVKLDNGDLLCSFRRAPNRVPFGADRNYHVDPNSYLVSVKSTDGGMTWTKEPQLMFAHPFGGSQDPCLLKLANGDILCTSYYWIQIGKNFLEEYKDRFYIDNWAYAGGFLIRSNDGGATWQGPLDPGSPLPTETRSTMLGKFQLYNRGALCQSPDGTISWAVACENGREGGSSVYLVQSHDNGVTWEYRSPIIDDDSLNFNETSIYETPNGDLVAFIRSLDWPSDEGYISRSTDGGVSFKSEGMGFQGHPFHALRLPDNRVLLTYGYRHEPYGIKAKILNPECTDFREAPEIIIREDAGGTDIGYTWSEMIDDTHVLVSYYYNFEQQQGVRKILGTILEIK